VTSEFHLDRKRRIEFGGDRGKLPSAAAERGRLKSSNTQSLNRLVRTKVLPPDSGKGPSPNFTLEAFNRQGEGGWITRGGIGLGSAGKGNTGG